MSYPSRLSWLLALLLPLLLLPTLHAEEAALHEDEDYRFRIRAPSSSWRVLNEADIQAITPDAVAGMANESGTWMAVIVESAPGAEVEAFGRLVFDSMPLEEKKLEAWSALTFQGKPAIRFVASGRVSEIHVRYVNTVYQSGDYICQVIVWAPFSRATEGFEKAALEAFEILPGPITGRAVHAEVPDSEGVGWRVRGGAFESAALGVAVRPTGDWKLAVGDALEAMNPDAEVGLVHANPDLYMALLVEPAPGVEKKGFLRALLDGHGEEELERTGYSLQLDLVGRQVTAYGFRLPAHPGFEILKGAFFVGDLCFQVVLWYATPTRTLAVPHLREACAAVRLLSKPEIGTLAEELRLGPDPENKVGERYALRRGLYQDFASGFILQKPEQEFWRMLAGDEARAQNPDASLVLEHPSLGVMGVVIAEEAADVEHEAYHTVVADAVFGEGREGVVGKDRTLLADGIRLRMTEGSQTEDTLEMGYRVATAVANGHAYQVILYGLANNMRAASRQIDRLLGGVRVAASLPVVEESPTRFTDHRMGYAFETEAAWQRRDQTPPEIAPIGSFQTWRQRDELRFVLSLCALRPGQDAAWFRSLLGSIMERATTSRILAEPTRHPASIGGIAGEVLTWSLPGGRSNNIWLIHRDRTFFATALVSDSGFTTEEVTAFQARFTLLD